MPHGKRGKREKDEAREKTSAKKARKARKKADRAEMTSRSGGKTERTTADQAHAAGKSTATGKTAASRKGADARKAADAAGTSPARKLPEDRPSLLALHRELRHRRDALPLLSEERAETVIELARVEVQVARVERAMDPPLG
jgi:hypothetical protein